ncbi:MAG: DNA polymerase I [Desulfuromonadaceae bacterium]|nr:DNA polymerase I [Desulfuromonadaceae bacterium]
MAQNHPHLYIVDASSYIYRAYFAIRHLSTSRGQACNAVFGFTKMLLKVVRECNPDEFIVVYDAKGPNFRHELYPEYKANRAKMPDDLVEQIPLIKQVVAGFGFASLETPGYEADDIIATIVRHYRAKDLPVTIVSGDKDLLQLVSEKVIMLDTMKDKVFDLAAVAERFGGGPELVVEVQSLAGDSSDNVPGVPGIGEKTARELITRFGSLENLLQNIDAVSGPKRRENLKEYAEQARLSRQLVTLTDDLELDLADLDCTIPEPDRKELARIFRELEFQQLYDEFAEHEPKPQQDCDYTCVTTVAALKELVRTLEVAEYFSIDTETTSVEAMSADLVGLSFSVKAAQGWYVPVGHCLEDDTETQLERDVVLETLRPVLEARHRPKVGQNIKYDALVLRRAGVELRGIVADTMLQSYLLFPASRSHGLSAMALEHLSHRMLEFSEVAGSGKKQISFAQVPLAQATTYAVEDSDYTLRLYELFKGRFDAEVSALLSDVELPLLGVLTDMEWDGISLDSEHLQALSSDFGTQIAALETLIYAAADSEFNLNSPKQLGEVLFDNLGLPHGKKTKTGWSTAVDVLTPLAAEHEIVARILEYRSLAKLKSTYTDALPRLVHPETGRIHTSFNQAVTATGRLSSSNPNLQNIPIRGSYGPRIREAFIPTQGNMLLAADYSQIELRLVAHMADDANMIQGFNAHEDIHLRTAQQVFNVFSEMVTEDMRRYAKTINFGLLYGMGAYSLSRELKISTAEAKEYITSYFARYPQVLEFFERQKNSARQDLYVKTLLGRHCAVPEINSRNGQVRSNAERNAVNYAVQGSAADIIKVAMVRIWETLRERGLKTRMLLQVHDELVFDVPRAECAEVETLVRHCMENVMQLKVPLDVSLGWGKNWAEAH